MAYTFKGGIRTGDYKLTAKSKIRDIPSPPQVKISLKQGSETYLPTVSAGASVRIGDVIAVPHGDEAGCPIHASISGVVRVIEDNGGAVVIENDGRDEVTDSLTPCTVSITDMSPEEITEVIRKAGIMGMGGTSYPTYKKIAASAGKCEYLIVNCAESEPFITADHRLLLEEPDKIIGGIKILMRAIGVPTAYIAITDNKEDAIRRMSKKSRGCSLISVKTLKTRYPQGDERQLVYALTGRELAQGKLPADAGCAVFNPATCAAVYDAFATGMPSVSRVVTVSGDCISSPANLRVPIGTCASYLVEQCGGLTRPPKRMLKGGLMTGEAMSDPDIVVDKSTAGLLYLSSAFAKKPSASSACIRCGRCMQSCPMHLMPSLISGFARHGDMESAKKYGAMSCIECGVCSYVCPGKVEVSHYIRSAKRHSVTEALD